jgi:hypothetical protein
VSSSKPDLQHIRWKLARSKEQLDALRDDITAYMDDAPYRLITEPYADVDAPNGEAIRLKIRIDKKPPDADWSGRIGEVAYNARSALDQLVVQLIVASGNTPRTGSRTQYPIFLSAQDYRDKSKGARQSRRDRMLEGVSSRFRRIIDDTQPYHRSGRIDRDPLAILGTISNRDKHRQPHSCLAWMRTFSGSFVYPDGRFIGVALDPRGNADSPQPVSDGDTLVSLAPGEPNARLEISDEFDVQVGFETDTGVITVDDLERVVGRISEIIDRASSKISP